MREEAPQTRVIPAAIREDEQDGEVGPRELGEGLKAGAAWRHMARPISHHDHRDRPAMARRDAVEKRHAFRAEGQAGARVLDVRAGHDLAVREEDRRPDRKPAVRRVGPPPRRNGHRHQRFPIHAGIVTGASPLFMGAAFRCDSVAARGEPSGAAFSTSRRPA